MIFISSLRGRIFVRRATLHPSLEGLLRDGHFCKPR